MLQPSQPFISAQSRKSASRVTAIPVVLEYWIPCQSLSCCSVHSCPGVGHPPIQAPRHLSVYLTSQNPSEHEAILSLKHSPQQHSSPYSQYKPTTEQGVCI